MGYLKVYCPNCGEYHDTREIEFVNIEEDYVGDIATFICPVNGEQYQSYVFGS